MPIALLQCPVACGRSAADSAAYLEDWMEAAVLVHIQVQTIQLNVVFARRK